MLPDSEFSVNRTVVSGLQSRCKECNSDYQRLHKQRLEPEATAGDGGEPAVEPASEEPTTKRSRMAEHLYIMALSVDPTGAVHGLKVGRSGDVQQRANTLGDTMPFTLVVLATFPGAGHVEKRVHTILDYKRNTEGRGREWFHLPLSTITQMVGIAMEQPRDWCQGSTSRLSKG